MPISWCQASSLTHKLFLSNGSQRKGLLVSTEFLKGDPRDLTTDPQTVLCINPVDSLITSLLTICFLPRAPAAPGRRPGGGVVQHTPYSYEVRRTFQGELGPPAPVQSPAPLHRGAVPPLEAERRT